MTLQGSTRSAVFCVIVPAAYGWTQDVVAAITLGCVPVLITEEPLEPVYNHAVEWMKMTVKWAGSVDSDLINTLRAIPQRDVQAALDYTATVRKHVDTKLPYSAKLYSELCVGSIECLARLQSAA